MGRVQIRVVMVSVAVAALVLVAAILGSVAERASSKSFAGYDGRYCVYRRTAALGCGVAAALFLLASQAVLGAASGCFGRCGEARARPIQRRRRTIVASMAGIYWSLTAAATALFLYAASRNVGGSNLPRRGRYHSMRGCKVFDRGVFSSASVTSAITAFVGITAYVYQETADTDDSDVASPDVPLEQRPHFQPQQSYPAVGYPAAPPPPPPYGGYGAKAPAGTT